MSNNSTSSSASISQNETKVDPLGPGYYYMNFVENIITVIVQLVSIPLLCHLLYSAVASPHRLVGDRKGLSRSIFTFLLTHLVSDLLCIGYNLYMVVLFRPPTTPSAYEPYWLYWTGIGSTTYMILQPAAALFLTLDRILSLKLNYKYTHRMSNMVHVIEVVVLFSICGISYTTYLMELPLNYKAVQSCTSFFCLTLKYNVSTYRHMLVMRLTLAFLVVVSSTVFLCQLRSMSKLNIKTRVVKMTIWFELIFDILPASVVAFNTVWEKAAGYQLSFIPYINKKTVVTGSLDTLCCGLFYSWILLRRFHTKSEDGHTNGGNNGVVFVSSVASSVTQTNLELKSIRKTI